MANSCRSSLSANHVEVLRGFVWSYSRKPVGYETAMPRQKPAAPVRTRDVGESFMCGDDASLARLTKRNFSATAGRGLL
jgi:hypothetical protein